MICIQIWRKHDDKTINIQQKSLQFLIPIIHIILFSLCHFVNAILFLLQILCLTYVDGHRGWTEGCLFYLDRWGGGGRGCYWQGFRVLN